MRSRIRRAVDTLVLWVFSVLFDAAVLLLRHLRPPAGP